MAGQAFKATERQFMNLLDSASEDISIHASFYRLPGLSQAEAGGAHFASHYASVETLWDSHLDGLIVTGREPKTIDLREETYWQDFTQVLEWARRHTHSTVWSCLAAHAAVLHMDGIERVRSDAKHFGVFDCNQDSEHALMQGVPSRFGVPHSRWNGIARKDLLSGGYRVLTATAEGSVDTFVKDEEHSVFVFLQGHPEYDTDTLMREYRRDVARFVKGETDVYPTLPSRYFDYDTERALTELGREAESHRSVELVNRVAAVLESAKIENTWQIPATRIYRNWLRSISIRKSVGQVASERNARSVAR
jgi:homoserine O-succinyltransferase